MIAVIQAGGKGTRIREVNSSVPKPLIPIEGTPVLFRQIDALLEFGVSRVIILAGYLGDIVQAESQKRYDSRVQVIIEKEPLGSGGCLALVRDQITDDVLVVGGDLVFEMDLAKLMTFHKEKNAWITMVVHPNRHPRDSDLVEIDAAERIQTMHLRPHPPGFKFKNLVNAGISVVRRECWELIKDNCEASYEKNLVQPLIESGKPVYAYNTSEYIRDMGTPKRFAEISEDLKKGLPQARSLKHKQKAVFLDRDGVINVHKDFITNPSQIELEKGVADAIRMLNNSAFLTIVASNQPQVARNLCTLEGIGEIHKELETQLGDAAVKLDDIFFCPHHPDSGFAGENKAYKIKCNCRKPATGMIDTAVQKYNIDPKQSFFIGDTTGDILAGQRAGLKTILVQTGLAGQDRKYEVKPDFVAKDLTEAVVKLLGLAAAE